MIVGILFIVIFALKDKIIDAINPIAQDLRKCVWIQHGLPCENDLISYFQYDSWLVNTYWYYDRYFIPSRMFGVCHLVFLRSIPHISCDSSSAMKLLLSWSVSSGAFGKASSLLRLVRLLANWPTSSSSNSCARHERKVTRKNSLPMHVWRAWFAKVASGFVSL